MYQKRCRLFDIIVLQNKSRRCYMDAFDRIIGYEKQKHELKMLCDMVKNSEKYKALGVRLPRGLLLYGMPGVGKTLMATALIEDMGTKCYTLRKDAADGQFIDKIGSTFAEAKANAPSVVFLDDLDKFTSNEISSKPEELVAVQSAMDGVKDADVFVIATANDFNALPKSLMRAGRFDRLMRINVPNKTEAKDIIRHYLKDKKISSDISPEVIARILDGESCAKLEGVLNEAGIYAGYEGENEISRRHIVHAVLRSETDDASDCAVSDAVKLEVAFHEAGHAVAAYTFDKDSLGVISVSSPFNETCGVTQILLPDDYFYSLELMKQRVMAILAGRAAVEIKFGHIDAGASSDVDRAFTIVRQFVMSYGTSGFRFLYCKNYQALVPYQKIDEAMDETNRVLERMYEQAKDVLRAHWQQVEQLAAALIERGTLLYDEVEELFGID